MSLIIFLLVMIGVVLMMAGVITDNLSYGNFGVVAFCFAFMAVMYKLLGGVL